ncbi:ABC transporter ATP-binding protein [Legionella bozemanae]|uniref:ABC transporter ATP-binding protein n=1 Tax=Legionella bozemanae TaxID=447 RepID=UPI003EE9661C
MPIIENNNKFSSFFLKVAAPYRWWFLAMSMVGIYSSIHSVIQPYVLKVILDRVTTSGATSFVSKCLPPALLLITLGFLITLVWRFYNYLVFKSLPRIKADIVTIVTEHLRNQSYAFFQDRMSGDISAKISDLTNNIQNVVNSWFNIARQALTILLSIFIVGTVSCYFSAIFLVVSAVFVYLSYYCASSIRPYAKDYAEAKTKYSGAIVDCFNNILNVLLFARENYEAKYLTNNTNLALEKETKMQVKNMLNASLLGFFAWVLQSTSILVLVYLGAKGQITAGDFAFVFILSITVIDQIWYLTESLLVIGEQAGVCQNALDTILTPHLQPLNSEDSKLRILEGKIEFKEVNFNYIKDKKTISDFSLTIKGGNKIGLVGFSGAGKSTIVQLMTKLYDIDKGDILIDGQSIKDTHRQSLREHIAFIPQDPSLFHRSIFENIQYGCTEATHDQIIRAAKQAHAHEFISQLPQGYETLVGEKGVKLSGGQRQRIAIARAILKNAPILILDEATSSLDSITEELIKQSLNSAMNNRTVIVIAHRLSTLLSMDTIVVMDQGKIIEQGSHSELITLNGFYKNLWDAQSGHSLI